MRFWLTGWARAVLLCGLLLAGAEQSTAAEVAAAPQDPAGIQSAITDLLANEAALPLPVRQRREALGAYYEEHGGALIWIGSPRMAELVDRLKRADEDGLDPTSYPSAQLAKLTAQAGSADAHGKAATELTFSAAFLEFASDLRVGRFLPRKIDPDFFLQDKTIDQLAALTAVAQAASVAEFFAGWQPKSPDYAALKAALARYRAIAKAGGWPTVPLGPALKPGMDDPRLPTVRARLAVTDGPLGPDSGEHYDDALEAVVQGFQARSGIEPNGVIGNQTIAALNVPVEDRNRQHRRL
jgi:murein L,D-transpeptidase YcbB/YkuD